jgi:hypothetical protein
MLTAIVHEGDTPKMTDAGPEFIALMFPTREAQTRYFGFAGFARVG